MPPKALKINSRVICKVGPQQNEHGKIVASHGKRGEKRWQVIFDGSEVMEWFSARDLDIEGIPIHEAMKNNAQRGQEDEDDDSNPRSMTSSDSSDEFADDFDR